jgi:rifampin ADP-ribosylating transferase
MDNQFNPNNKIIQILLQGMGMEDSGKLEEASFLVLKAWSEATDDFERFIFNPTEDSRLKE